MIQKNSNIVFLKKFTEEIIYNLSKKYIEKNNVEIQKIKQKFLEEETQNIEDFNKIINHKIVMPYKYQKEEPNSFEIINEIKESKPKNVFFRKPPPEKLPPSKTFYFEKKTKNEKTPKVQEKETINTKEEEDIYFDKIKVLLNDPFVETIESAGPGKNVLVKKLNKIYVTKIVLTQEDINKIIEDFSNKAKIPLVSGMLKAAVGKLLISAVASEFAGSRFIINKINS